MSSDGMVVGRTPPDSAQVEMKPRRVLAHLPTGPAEPRHDPLNVPLGRHQRGPDVLGGRSHLARLLYRRSRQLLDLSALPPSLERVPPVVMNLRQVRTLRDPTLRTFRMTGCSLPQSCCLHVAVVACSAPCRESRQGWWSRRPCCKAAKRAFPSAWTESTLALQHGARC